MTVADLREIINDPDLPPDARVRVHVTLDGRMLKPKQSSSFEWELQGAHGTLAGPDRHLVLELYAPMADPPEPES